MENIHQFTYPDLGTGTESPHLLKRMASIISANGSITSHSSSFSSNATASNLVGAGRTIGLLYSSGGRRLEGLLANLAQRSGYGPWARYSELLNIKDETSESSKREHLLTSNPTHQFQ